MSKQELNERLAEWSGFTHLPYLAPDGVKYQDACFVEPGYTSQVSGHWSFSPPNFTESLDACFRWLRPAVFSKCTGSVLTWTSILRYWVKEMALDGYARDHQALTLCCVISKRIESGAIKERSK